MPRPLRGRSSRTASRSSPHSPSTATDTTTRRRGYFSLGLICLDGLRIGFWQRSGIGGRRRCDDGGFDCQAAQEAEQECATFQGVLTFTYVEAAATDCSRTVSNASDFYYSGVTPDDLAQGSRAGPARSPSASGPAAQVALRVSRP